MPKTSFLLSLIPILAAFLCVPANLPAQADGHGQHHQAFTSPDSAAKMPTEPGEGAFATIQEIVTLLENDPATDWRNVSILALREHLVDMSEVFLHAQVQESRIENGIDILAKGSGRTLAALQRMVPAHARMIQGYRGWKVEALQMEEGMRLVVTSKDPDEAQHIRGLGFFGIMTSGAHHQEHHFRIAKGEHVH
jgi:hypothetical protein